MDEVFGNSSTETVVSIHDLSEERNESVSAFKDDLNSSAQCTERLVNNESSAKAKDQKEEYVVVKKDANDVPINRVSVIRCLETFENHELEIPIFKIPDVPEGLLKHAKSAIVQKSETVLTRTRANSTSLTSNSKGIAFKYHPYQNVPIHVNMHRNSPPYVNLPPRTSENSHGISATEETIKNTPHTPREYHHDIIPKFHGSYIQLWTGIKEKENTYNSENEFSQKMPENGYVSMSSPLIRSPNSSILSELANQLSSNFGNNNAKHIFCPFCPRPFTLEPNLKHHIQAIHRHELQKIVCQKEPVFIQYCPICRGRFLNLDLLPSHLLEFHRDSVVEIFDHYENIKLEKQEIKCPFCIKKVSASNFGEDILLYHILQLHCEKYEEFIRSVFKPIQCYKNKESLSKLSTENLAHALSFKPEITSTPGLSLKFKSLSCETSINDFEDTWSSHCGSRTENKVHIVKNPITEIVNKGILRSQTDLCRKPSVKRELRFSVPPVTSEEFFIPESPESSVQSKYFEEYPEEQDENWPPVIERLNIPVRIDSLSSADFIELNHVPSRKRRRLGVGLKSKKSFKKKKKETLVDNVFDGLKNIGCSKKNQTVIATSATRTFRKPNSTQTNMAQRVPPVKSDSKLPLTKRRLDSNSDASSEECTESITTSEELLESSPFGNMKLYSLLRMFRCNGCRLKFCDNDSLSTHIRNRHRGILGILRPQYGCGICSAKYYENKYLVKHCLQHHTSLLEIRSPKKHKITIYRFSED